MTLLTLLAIEWTDVAQAIGALLAIPGAIAAFWILFQRDKAKEEAVRQLAQQTKHLGEQSAQMERQAENLRGINQALIGVFTGQKEQAEVARVIRRNQIRPFFQPINDDFYGPDGWHSTLVNKGGAAFTVHPLIPDNTPWMVRSDDHAQHGEQLNILIVPTFQTLPSSVTFQLYFTDEDGNVYHQKFDAAPASIYAYEPVPVTTSTNAQH